MTNEIKAFLVNIKGNEEYKFIYDYITNLQERIDKAIEYINEHFIDGIDGELLKRTGENTCEKNYKFLEDLEKILQGEDK